MPFYAVAKGRKQGIYSSWADCEMQVKNVYGAIYKKFPTKDQALAFIEEKSSNITDRRINAVSKNHSTSLPQAASSSASLSPTFSRMQQDLQKLQAEMDVLKQQFEDYIASKSGQNNLELSVTTCSKKRRKSSNTIGTNISVSNNELHESVKKVKSQNIQHKFTVDQEGFVVVYTDGACEQNGRVGAKAGVGVFFGPNHPMNVSEPVRGRPTNNTAEIQAATYALELSKAAGFDKVFLNTDSQFMINCMTSWLPNWRRNGWKTTSGSDVKNKEDLIDLDKATQDMVVKWNHVRGHVGIPGNEAADALAREGATKYK